MENKNDSQASENATPTSVEMFSDWSSVSGFLGATAEAGSSALWGIVKLIFWVVIFQAALKFLLPIL